MDRLTVVYGSDQRLYFYLPMAINSLLMNNSNAKVYVLAADTEIKGLDHPNVEIIDMRYQPPAAYPGTPNFGHFYPPMCFNRL